MTRYFAGVAAVGLIASACSSDAARTTTSTQAPNTTVPVTTTTTLPSSRGLDDFFNQVGSGINNAANEIGNAGNQLGTAISGAADEVGGFFEGLGNDAGTFFTNAGNDIVTFFGGTPPVPAPTPEQRRAIEAEGLRRLQELEPVIQEIEAAFRNLADDELPSPASVQAALQDLGIDELTRSGPTRSSDGQVMYVNPAGNIVIAGVEYRSFSLQSATAAAALFGAEFDGGSAWGLPNLKLGDLPYGDCSVLGGALSYGVQGGGASGLAIGFWTAGLDGLAGPGWAVTAGGNYGVGATAAVFLGIKDFAYQGFTVTVGPGFRAAAGAVGGAYTWTLCPPPADPGAKDRSG